MVAPLQMGERGVAEEDRALHVHREDVVEQLGGEVLDPGEAGVDRVVHHDVDAAVGGHRGIDDGRQRADVAQVGHDPEGVAAECGDLGDGGVEVGAGAAARDHAGTEGGEPDRHGPAESPTAAGDDGDTSVEVERGAGVGHGGVDGHSVELRGIEPLTPSMPWKCSTN